MIVSPSEGLALRIPWVPPKWWLWLYIWGTLPGMLQRTPLGALSDGLKLLGFGLNPLLNPSLEAPTFPWIRYSYLWLLYLCSEGLSEGLRRHLLWVPRRENDCKSLRGTSTKDPLSPSKVMIVTIYSRDIPLDAPKELRVTGWSF